MKRTIILLCQIFAISLLFGGCQITPKPVIEPGCLPYAGPHHAYLERDIQQLLALMAERDRMFKGPIIQIFEHYGNEQCDFSEMQETVRAVLKDLPNIELTDETELLAMETMMVETHMGLSNYSKTAPRSGNYGVAQIRVSTAKYLLEQLQKRNQEAYLATMKYYNDEQDMKWNLNYNVPFGISVMMQYYHLRIPNLMTKISTADSRGALWKKFYNTEAGRGSKAGYLKRSRELHNEFYSTLA